MLRRWRLVVLLGVIVGLNTTAQDAPPDLTFSVTADMRMFAGAGAYDSVNYFRGACEAINTIGKGAFMLSPGDIDPPWNVFQTITSVFDADYPWYPVVGNHEAETPEDMTWLLNYLYGTVNPGPTGCPTTTYSFDISQAHFVVLNEYCDASGPTATTGDVPDHLYNWLAADLQNTDKPSIFVAGHEPAFPQPDADNGLARHLTDSLNQYPANRDRFWQLLEQTGVTAYLCGHTHSYSAVQIGGIWQIDAGQARGVGDTSTPSTFLMMHVAGQTATFDAYRDIHDGVYDYDDIRHHGIIRAANNFLLWTK